jgi:hypothetical protein
VTIGKLFLVHSLKKILPLHINKLILTAHWIDPVILIEECA